MKNQYFGDIDDYRKYGILRSFTAAGIQVGVHWMLTPDDSSGDGRKLSYLEAAAAWRDHDPGLFDFLRSAVTAGKRGVATIQSSNILPGVRYFDELVPDRGVARAQVFSNAVQALAGSHLVFFDPDVGIEVSSTQVHHAGSSKYVYWKELISAWRNGHSLLVYQHYPRVSRPAFEERLALETHKRLSVNPVFLRTGNVLFVLATQRDHASLADLAVRNLATQWSSQFTIGRFPATE